MCLLQTQFSQSTQCHFGGSGGWVFSWRLPGKHNPVDFSGPMSAAFDTAQQNICAIGLCRRTCVVSAKIVFIIFSLAFKERVIELLHLSSLGVLAMAPYSETLYLSMACPLLLLLHNLEATGEQLDLMDLQPDPVRLFLYSSVLRSSLNLFLVYLQVIIYW